MKHARTLYSLYLSFGMCAVSMSPLLGTAHTTTRTNNQNQSSHTHLTVPRNRNRRELAQMRNRLSRIQKNARTYDLFAAITRNDPIDVKRALENGATPNGERLSFIKNTAVKKGNLDVLRLMAAFGTDFCNTPLKLCPTNYVRHFIGACKRTHRRNTLTLDERSYYQTLTRDDKRIVLRNILAAPNGDAQTAAYFTRTYRFTDNSGTRNNNATQRVQRTE